MPTRADSTGQRTYFFDPTYSPPRGSNPWQLFEVLGCLNDIGTGFNFEDEFHSLSTGASGRWQIVKGTGGTVALNTTTPCLGGWVSIPTAASASNDYQLLATQAPIFNLTANKPIAYEFIVQVTEANTNTASWAVGLSSTLTTGFLSNAGAPPSSYSGAVFWKATGALTLAFQTANATTKKTVANVASVVSGSTYAIGAALLENDGITGTVYPYVSTITNGLRTLTVAVAPQTLTIASLANMYLFAAIRTASANAETLQLDFAQGRGIR